MCFLEFLEKNANITDAIPNLIYTPNFIRIGQWKSVHIRGGGKIRGEGRGKIKKKANVTNGIPKWIYVASVIQIVRRKVFKIRGKGLGGGGVKIQEGGI